MKLNLQPYHLEEITNKGFNMNHICMLKFIYEGVDISSFVDEKEKLAIVIQEMIRKGVLTEEKKITSLGTELLVFMDSKAKRRIIRPKTDDGEFDLWWKHFPSTDTFSYKGKTFTGCRSLKAAKDECKIKFDKILLEGEYKAENLIAALDYEVEQKKEMSLKTGTNKLAFMKNSLSYLNQRAFESYIELINTKPEETISIGGTDI